jgi:outer membrane protein assembly factor BamD
LKRLSSKLWALPLAATILLSACHAKKYSVKNGTPGTAAEPDKVLYERSLDDIKHTRYDVGRLNLQTLINTYPDSEYLAKAKLAIADSYYKEGGTGSLNQAILEYKDFETFFPFLDEAAYAQMQVGMAYYRQMMKPDRDRTQALNAEVEFQTLLQKYPNSKYAAPGEQRLREVQEVLAEGDDRIATFYYDRHSDRASAARLLDLTARYPLYSKAPEANWMLGQIYLRNERKDFAVIFYSRIVKNYPLSPLAADAKDMLTKLGAPIPQPDPTALARMQKEQNTPRQRSSLISKPLGALRNGPDVSTAARVGEPNLTPEGESEGETLTPGTMSAGGGGPSNTAVVATVAPGTNGNAASTSSTSPGSTSGSETPASTAPGSTGDAPVGSNTVTPAATNPNQPPPDASGPAPTTDPATPPAAGAPQAPPSTSSSSSATSSPSSSSSSSLSNAAPKKKKGIKKLIPW